MNQSLKILQITFFAAVILYVGQALWVTLSFAMLLSFVLYPSCHWLENHRVPRFLSITIVMIIFCILLSLLLALLVQQFYGFLEQWPELSGKIRVQLDRLLVTTEEFFALDQDWWRNFFTTASQSILQQLPKTLLNTSVSTLLVLLVPVFSGLILYYRDLLVAFVLRIIPKRWKVDYQSVLKEVLQTYFSFIKGMTLVYLIVGLLNSIGLMLIGIPQAFFFGFVASILTFIPYVGITVGALLPITVAWLTYDSVLYPIGVIVVFVIVQILEANIIFPVAVSFKLRINTFVTMVAIVAGGILWGASGMILFIPFLAILKLLAEKVSQLRALAILLGTTQDLKKYNHGKTSHPKKKPPASMHNKA
ncbi:AI-2E family transporter [Catalinimonas alkaloidigena]|uniref:AI-2E family transporter n=1 Tax=Catalinimonas alkaloidigena TaxID=1075417 RepID=UPI00240584D0|nr:AI-2E family transporter [Catalinimonas alkaloidigena]